MTKEGWHSHLLTFASFFFQGHEARFPITVRGKGLGPAAVFSYDVLDVGHTYANTPHQYEVELQNRGKIDVEFKWVPPGSVDFHTCRSVLHLMTMTNTVPSPDEPHLTAPLRCRHYRLLEPHSPFSKKFTFEPNHGHLSGGEIQIIRVRLMSDLLGAFAETFKWAIKGSSVPLALQLKGHVAGPSFEVDASVLDFGVVSYGFR